MKFHTRFAVFHCILYYDICYKLQVMHGLYNCENISVISSVNEFFSATKYPIHRTFWLSRLYFCYISKFHGFTLFYMSGGLYFMHAVFELVPVLPQNQSSWFPLTLLIVFLNPSVRHIQFDDEEKNSSSCCH